MLQFAEDGNMMWLFNVMNVIFIIILAFVDFFTFLALQKTANAAQTVNGGREQKGSEIRLRGSESANMFPSICMFITLLHYRLCRWLSCHSSSA